MAEFNTYLAKINNTYMPMIQRQMDGMSITFSEYQKKCVMNAIASINQLLDSKEIRWNDESLDQSNITQVLFNVASLELNPVAEPQECYFQIRNVRKTKNGKEVWEKKVEFGIMADGYDAILARFGRGVKKVYPFWLVRENDEFEYPRFNGLELTPPQWTPKGTGKVVRVVYPILHDDNTLHFYIGEREDVARNLLAHINNNLMNETFGIAENRFKASAAQIEKIDKKKKELKAKAKELGLDAITDPELSKYISPSWKEDFSQESMIIRKMRNNVVKKIPKDFGHSSVQEAYAESTDDAYAKAKNDIIEHTATVQIEELDPSGEQNGAISEVLEQSQRDTGVKPETVLNGDLERQSEIRQKPDFS